MDIDKKLKKARETAISWVTSKGYSSIKASFGEFSEPKSFISQGETISPAITAESITGKSYFVIAQKTSAQKQQIVTKWKLFSRLAKMKNGQFVIFAPHGHKTFAERIILNYRISARVISI